ncbi:hypothetical protein ACVMGE_008238 [Bradyrhizobium diazoefficiens]
MAERDSSWLSSSGCADQPVLVALGFRQLLVQQAFAYAEGREHDGLGLCHADDVLEHQRRVGEERAPRIGNDLDIGEHVGGRQTAKATRKVERLGCGDGIAVHHLERIAALDDVDARERAPGAADGVECTAAPRLELRHLVELLAHDTVGALERFVGEVLEREPAERQRHAAAHAVPAHVDQFERAAAEVADDAVGVVDAGNHAERRQPRLARARQDLDLHCADALGLGDEVGAVGGIAAGGGRDREHASDLHHAAQRAESLQRGQRLVDGVGREQARALHLAPEAAQRLLVEDRNEAPRQSLVDDEADRVGTDVDDRDARAALARPSHVDARSGWMAFVPARETTRRGFLERLSTARQTRICHEVVVDVERLLALRGLHTR